MNSIRFEDLSPTDDAENIVWHNMKMCDDIYNLQLFISCSLAWLKLNPTKNFQDLELELRKRDFNTHLYAKDIPMNSQYACLLNSKKCDYECIFSCRPKQFALEEVLKFHKTYEINFEKLANSGVLCLEPEKELRLQSDKDENIKVFTDKEKSISQLLIECKKKMILVRISAEDYIREICLKCKEVYGKEPEHKLVGVSHEGGPIIGLFLGEHPINEYGYVIECSKDGKAVEKHMRLEKIFN